MKSTARSTSSGNGQFKAQALPAMVVDGITVDRLWEVREHGKVCLHNHKHQLSATKDGQLFGALLFRMLRFQLPVTPVPVHRLVLAFRRHGIGPAKL